MTKGNSRAGKLIPGEDLIHVTPNSQPLPGGPCTSLFIGAEGTVDITTLAGNERDDVPVEIGIFPIQCTHVRGASSSVSDNIWAIPGDTNDEFLYIFFVEFIYNEIPFDKTSGLPMTTILDAGRIDYEDNVYVENVAVIAVSNNLLTYGAYTNEITWSRDISDDDWSVVGGTVSGTNLLLESIGAEAHLANQAVSSSENEDYILSAKLKGEGRDWARLTFNDRSGSFIRAWYNLSIGAIGIVETGGTATIETAENGYYLCSLKVNSGAGGASLTAYVITAKQDNENSYAGDITKGLHATDIQVTETSVRMPFAFTEASAVSVPENNSSDAAGGRGYKFVIGDGTTMGDNLRDAFDGVADGSELVTNGDSEAALPTMNGVALNKSGLATLALSTEQSHSGTSSVKCIKNNTNQLANTRFLDGSDCGLILGFYYEVSVWVYLPSGQTVDTLQLWNRSGVGANTVLDSTVIADTWVKLTGRFVDDDSERILVVIALNDTVDTEFWYIDDQSIKAVSTAAATMEILWTPKFAYTDTVGSGNIITVNDDSPGILSHKDDGTINLTDGTTIASVDIDYQAIPYLITSLWGPTSDLSSEKVVDGTFVEACGVNWTCGTGWAIALNTATATATTGFLQQSDVVENGKTYQIEFDVDSVSGDTYSVQLGSTNAGQLTGTGHKTVEVEASGTIFYIIPWSGTGLNIEISNVSIKATNQPKMQILVEDTTGATGPWASDVVDFAGRFPISDDLSIAWENDLPQLFDSIEILKEGI